MLEYCFPCVEFIGFEFKFICIQIVCLNGFSVERKKKEKGKGPSSRPALPPLAGPALPSPLLSPRGPRPGPVLPARASSPPSRAQPPTARSPSFLSLAARSHRSAPFFPLSSFLPGAQRPEISGDLFTLGPHAKGTSPPFK
jgi:hypothetical protein